MTELHEAASLGDLERLEEALRKGLNPNEPDREWGDRTPLHIAVADLENEKGRIQTQVLFGVTLTSLSRDHFLESINF